MKIDDVPQDQNKAFEGQRKALYAVDDQGNYNMTTSNGWEAEEVVLDLALTQFDMLVEEAREKVLRGEASPLLYHMYANRMDYQVLAQSTGFFQWQVKRHCRTKHFDALAMKKLQRYCDAFALSVDELTTMPAALANAELVSDCD